jgi:L-arabinonolactonase
MRTLVTDTDQLGECPTWDEASGRFWWIDVVGKRIQSCAPDGSDIQRREVDDFPGSMALRERGGVVVAFRRRISLQDEAGREVASSALPPEIVAVERFNDGACDRRGRFFAGTMDKSLKAAVGGLYRIDPDLTITRLTDGIGIGNGIAWSPDDRRLFHCDSDPPVIHVHDYDIETGEVANRREFARFDPDFGKPDGCAMDAEGGLWVAAPGSGSIVRLDPDGRIERTLKTPVRFPSSIAFGGPDNALMFITSLQAPHVAPEPQDGCVFVTDAGVKGLPVGRFAG